MSDGLIFLLDQAGRSLAEAQQIIAEQARRIAELEGQPGGSHQQDGAN